MKILLTGGGTGGHITPILAVAHELKQLQPDCVTIYVGERGSKFVGLTKDHPAIDEVLFISAGKFRRYHNESWLRRVTDIKTVALNFRDLFRVFTGTIQAYGVLGRVKPDVVFLKGGFVGVPIGLAAALRRIPIVTHDSDALPGLANRLVGRWAYAHATALPARYYKYPPSKVHTVGVLVEPSFTSVNPAVQAESKVKLGLPPNAPLLLITGGSSGAERINEAVVSIISELLEKHSGLHVIHQVGKGKGSVYKNYDNNRLKIIEFLKPMALYTSAADLVVTRASANTMAELGVQGKACIVIPSPHLAGGHQLMNAARLEEQGAAKVLHEDMLHDSQQGLLVTILNLINSENERSAIANKLQDITIPNAANKLARLLLRK